MLPPLHTRRGWVRMGEQKSRYTNRGGSFYELAKGLPSGNFSRGKALRIMGAALVGGALASFPGAAWSKQQLDKEKKPRKGKKPDPDLPPTLP
jgi:hypothetical protein